MKMSEIRNLLLAVLAGALAILLSEPILDLFRSTSSIHADVYPAPFTLPVDQFELPTFLSLVDDKLAAWHEEEQANKNSPEFQPRMDYARAKEITDLLSRVATAQNLLIVSLSNTGDVQLQNVHLHIADALLFLRSDQPIVAKWGLMRRFGKVQAIAHQNGSIEIGVINQGETVDLFVWTSSTDIYDSWDGARRGIRLTFPNGTGDITVHRQVAGYLRFIDRNIFWIVMAIIWPLFLLQPLAQLVLYLSRRFRSARPDQ